MRVALSIMLMQECCNFICQWENEPGGVPIRIKHLIHSPYLTLIISLRGHLQTKIFTLNVIVTLKGGGGLWKMNMTLIFEISIARAQKDINSMQVQ